ncbi:MAG: hypothetical protein ACP5RI_00310 [Candidatus Micrarchaeia archaeon]
MENVSPSKNPMEPIVEAITLKGELKGSFSGIEARLSSLQMYDTKSDSDSLIVARVESRNIQKLPFMFMIFTFKKDSVELNYSYGSDTSPKLRRLSVLRHFIAIMSLISNLYTVDNIDLFQHLDSAIDDVLNGLSQDYGTLYNNYDSLFSKYRELRRLNIELANSNKNLSVQASTLSAENNELKERLKVLETYSDESLMAMVENWVDAHGGIIDINEFANNYKLTPPRVEEILNKMVTLGYIEIKG